jgi:mannose-6-phosphate isomerase-like protein (cupin superfamily)
MSDDHMTSFKYVRQSIDEGKRITILARTPFLIGAMQVVTKGGETNLHAHKHLDGFWMVLSGRARFYSDTDVVFAELAAYEGVLIPRGVKYWFEAVGDEQLEILQVEGSDVPLVSRQEITQDRIDYAPSKHLADLTG